MASLSFPFPVRCPDGTTAELRIVRNDGYCWGQLTRADGYQLEVDPPADTDLYDDDDEVAASVLEDCALRLLKGNPQ